MDVPLQDIKTYSKDHFNKKEYSLLPASVWNSTTEITPIYNNNEQLHILFEDFFFCDILLWENIIFESYSSGLKLLRQLANLIQVFYKIVWLFNIQ